MRVPLAVLNDPREATREKDEGASNVFLDEEASTVFAVKRPGLILTFATTGEVGQGVFIYPGTAYVPGEWAGAGLAAGAGGLGGVEGGGSGDGSFGGGGYLGTSGIGGTGTPGSAENPGMTGPRVFTVIDDVLYEDIPVEEDGSGSGGGGGGAVWVQI